MKTKLIGFLMVLAALLMIGCGGQGVPTNGGSTGGIKNLDPAGNYVLTFSDTVDTATLNIWLTEVSPPTVACTPWPYNATCDMTVSGASMTGTIIFTTQNGPTVTVNITATINPSQTSWLGTYSATTTAGTPLYKLSTSGTVSGAQVLSMQGNTYAGVLTGVNGKVDVTLAINTETDASYLDTAGQPAPGLLAGTITVTKDATNPDLLVPDAFYALFNFDGTVPTEDQFAWTTGNSIHTDVYPAGTGNAINGFSANCITNTTGATPWLDYVTIATGDNAATTITVASFSLQWWTCDNTVQGETFSGTLNKQ